MAEAIPRLRLPDRQDWVVATEVHRRDPVVSAEASVVASAGIVAVEGASEMRAEEGEGVMGPGEVELGLVEVASAVVAAILVEAVE